MKGGDWRINRSLSRLPKSNRAHHKKVRYRVLEALGAKCVICEFQDCRALHIDHVYSDGVEDRKKYKGTSYYYHILANIDSGRYQILCANCNFIKREEAAECPRKYSDNHVFETDDTPILRNYQTRICAIPDCNQNFVQKCGRQVYCDIHITTSRKEAAIESPRGQ